MIGLGTELMLVGMGVVFVFLTALVGAVTLMSRVVMHFQPAAPDSGAGEEEIAAITAAIARHRGDRDGKQ